MFSVSSPTSLQVPAHGRVTLQGRFAPPASGHYLAELVVHSNGPAGDPLLIAVNGSTADASGRLRVRVQPQTIRLGVSTQVTIITEDSGSATPSLTPSSAAGRSKGCLTRLDCYEKCGEASLLG